MGPKVGTPCAHLETIDARIQWVLDHPGMSPWLKSALRSALVEDPINLTNDLQVLANLIMSRSRIMMQKSLCDNGRP